MRQGTLAKISEPWLEGSRDPHSAMIRIGIFGPEGGEGPEGLGGGPVAKYLLLNGPPLRPPAKPVLRLGDCFGHQRLPA